MDKIEFRFAEPGDEGKILFFIRSLAKYERMENEVVATESVLSEWIFERKKAEVIFAVVDGKEAGFALFFNNFSTFLGRAGLYLEDLFVLPEYRGRGVGTALIRKLAGIALERGLGRMDWTCLDWNEPSIRFYKSLGAAPLSEWTIYRLEGETLGRAAKPTGEKE